MNKVPTFIDIIATGFYTGKMPFMPGTFGTLVAIPLAYGVSFLILPYRLAIFAFVFIIGIITAQLYEKYSGLHDPGSVVIDEIAAMMLLYAVFPFNVFYVVCGFILFRFFDIVKPFPVKYFEELPGGLGIMADDIIAVIYAGICCFMIKYFMEII